MNDQIIQGDALEMLTTLPDESVHCIITSPPYFGLRDYGVDGQMGLEETPEAFVAALVGVFHEAKRVLRSDGTLWLNLGDSYASNSPSGWQGKNGGRASRTFTDENLPIKRGSGIKPKDLIGIPWRVALALQQPYYTGKIKDEKDRVWLASMLDGEGCLYIHRRKEGQHAGDGYYRKADNYQCAFEIANTNKDIINRAYEIAGVGSITRQDKNRRQPIYRWTVRSNEAKDLIAEIYPFLVGKQHQARLCYGVGTNGDKAEAAWEGLKKLHAGQSCDIDFVSPKNLYEPGWYLRQDVIWSKPNPMPESVTDRCTRSHEYVFMLSKKPKYYYNAQAIKTPAKDPEDDQRRMRQQKQGNKSEPNSLRNGLRPREDKQRGHGRRHDGFNDRWDSMAKEEQASQGANKRDVWVVATRPFREAHFATFPEQLIEPMILAGCPAGGLVLDPFFGAGTTGVVARKNGRHYIGIELNPAYIEIAERRLSGTPQPLFV